MDFEMTFFFALPLAAIVAVVVVVIVSVAVSSAVVTIAGASAALSEVLVAVVLVAPGLLEALPFLLAAPAGEPFPGGLALALLAPPLPVFFLLLLLLFFLLLLTVSFEGCYRKTGQRAKEHHFPPGKGRKYGTFSSYTVCSEQST